MSAYVIAQIKWNDQEQYKKYIEAFYPLLESHGGTVLVATEDQTEVIEGSWSLPGTVVMRFPSVDHARAWMADPDYPAVAGIRHGAAETNLVLAEGRD
jgi:uncharacterized protein (DUF1330 family)